MRNNTMDYLHFTSISAAAAATFPLCITNVAVLLMQSMVTETRTGKTRRWDLLDGRYLGAFLTSAFACMKIYSSYQKLMVYSLA
ncbi:hypothetical protein TB2_025295 [Malus domestica]